MVSELFFALELVQIISQMSHRLIDQLIALDEIVRVDQALDVIDLFVFVVFVFCPRCYGCVAVSVLVFVQFVVVLKAGGELARATFDVVERVDVFA